MGVKLVNLVEELECTSWGTVVIGYSDLYRVGVLSVDIVRRDVSLCGLRSSCFAAIVRRIRQQQ
jgi:hypothetical protein